MLTPQVDSPIRRSIGNNRIHTQLDSPMIENDDEAERRVSRSRVSLAPDNATIQHKEGLDNCLKIFNDNKINKENVWQINLIDHFQALIDKHHKILNSFQKISSSLEASSKVYGIRVDSVHSDVLRMSSGLIRQQIVENLDDSLTANTSTNEANQEVEQRPPRRNKRPNRLVSTVTKNKDTINAKLETATEMDAIFAKLNSTVENNNSTKKLLQYVLSSFESELKLSMNYKIWNNEEAPINDPDACYNEPYDEIPEIKLNLLNDDDDYVLRPRIAGYIISNRPAEDDVDDQMDTSIETPNNISYIDAHFDINAIVEPIQVETGFIDVNIDGDDFGTLDEDDQFAISACRGLQRKSIVINDMRPDNISLDLEYSYRLLSEKIHRFWAGPSYWIFKRPRANTVPISLAEKKKKTIKNKSKPVELEDADESLYISTNGKPAAKLGRADFRNRRYNAKTNKLPFDFKLNRNRFLFFPMAPGVPMYAIHNSTAVPETDIYTHDISNYDNNDVNDNFGANNSVVSTQNACLNATVTEIGTEFVGAPEQVNQINIKFAKTAKVIDMKQLKHCCLNVIRKECKETATVSDLPSNSQTLNENYTAGSSSFYKIYKELPKKLTKNMKEALSPAVAFYSILHLANDNNFRLVRDDQNGFLIRQIL